MCSCYIYFSFNLFIFVLTRRISVYYQIENDHAAIVFPQKVLMNKQKFNDREKTAVLMMLSRHPEMIKK